MTEDGPDALPRHAFVDSSPLHTRQCWSARPLQRNSTSVSNPSGGVRWTFWKMPSLDHRPREDWRPGIGRPAVETSRGRERGSHESTQPGRRLDRGRLGSYVGAPAEVSAGLADAGINVVNIGGSARSFEPSTGAVRASVCASQPFDGLSRCPQEPTRSPRPQQRRVRSVTRATHTPDPRSRRTERRARTTPSRPAGRMQHGIYLFHAPGDQSTAA